MVYICMCNVYYVLSMLFEKREYSSIVLKVFYIVSNYSIHVLIRSGSIGLVANDISTSGGALGFL